MSTNLWRNRHHRPDVDESLNTVAFAVEKGIVGVGWPVEVDAGESLSWEDYETRAQQAGYPQKDAWVRSLTAIHEHMNEGDLCYSRDEAGRFYLGRISGSWRYASDPEFKRHALVNVRDCEWYRISDPEETVPPELMESFGRGAVLQRVQDPRLLAYSQRLFEVLADREIYEIELPYTMDEWFNDEDLKDLVAVYLQADENQVLLPSTIDQPHFKLDGITVNRTSARRTLYQIQHDEVRLSREAYSDEERRMVYLRRDDEAPGYLYDHVQVLELEDLMLVFDVYWDLLPRRIQIIAETLRDRGDLDWAGAISTLDRPQADHGGVNGGPSEDPEPAPSGRRRWVDGLVGFLLAMAMVGMFVAWLNTPQTVAKQTRQQTAAEQELETLRTKYRTVVAQRDELQETVNTMNEADESGEDAASSESPSESPRTDWVEVRVRWADTLSELFYRFQTSEEHYEEVIRRNNIQNPDLIYADSTLSFPARASKEQTARRSDR